MLVLKQNMVTKGIGLFIIYTNIIQIVLLIFGLSIKSR